MSDARLLGMAAAAIYLGVSPNTLRSAGIPRRIWGARRLYDRTDLDAWADTLPYENAENGENSCDKIEWGGTA